MITKLAQQLMQTYKPVTVKPQKRRNGLDFSNYQVEPSKDPIPPTTNIQDAVQHVKKQRETYDPGQSFGTYTQTIGSRPSVIPSINSAQKQNKTAEVQGIHMITKVGESAILEVLPNLDKKNILDFYKTAELEKLAMPNPLSFLGGMVGKGANIAGNTARRVGGVIGNSNTYQAVKQGVGRFGNTAVGKDIRNGYNYLKNTRPGQWVTRTYGNIASRFGRGAGYGGNQLVPYTGAGTRQTGRVFEGELVDNMPMNNIVDVTSGTSRALGTPISRSTPVQYNTTFGGQQSILPQQSVLNKAKYMAYGGLGTAGVMSAMSDGAQATQPYYNPYYNTYYR